MVAGFPHRLFALGVAGVAIVTGSVPAMAQQLEQSVKAAFLTKFPRYVDWPAGVGVRPTELCIVGNDPFGRIVDQAVRGDPGLSTIRRFERAEHARSCTIAFLAGTRHQSVGQMVAALNGVPVLTVTDSRLGSAQGIIHFAVQQGKVGFHVNNALAARSKLSISSRLLQLALSVRQRTG